MPGPAHPPSRSSAKESYGPATEHTSIVPYSAKTVDGNDYLTHGRDVAGLIDALGLKDIVLIGWSTGNLDTWSYVQQFGKDKLRGVVTIDMSPLPLSPDPKWWTEGTIEELSGRHTGVDFF